MRKLFVVLFLFAFLVSAFSIPAKRTSAGDNLRHSAYHMYVFENADGDAGTCTAYAIAPHALLTAEHCSFGDDVKFFVDPKGHGKEMLNDSQQQMKVLDRLYDGSEHMILIVDRTFTTYVPYAVEAPRQGMHFYFWGSPKSLRDQYREGYVSGVLTFTPEEAEKEEVNEEHSPTLGAQPVYTIVAVVVGGDSGSVLFDAENGKMIGVMTFGFNNGFGGIYPLAFTPGQIAVVENYK